MVEAVQAGQLPQLPKPLTPASPPKGYIVYLRDFTDGAEHSLYVSGDEPQVIVSGSRVDLDVVSSIMADLGRAHDDIELQLTGE